MSEKSGLVLLPSFMNAAERLPTEAQRWRFIKKLFLYRTENLPFEAEDDLEALAWDLIQPNIDASAARHAAAVANGKKGGNPNFNKGKPNPYFSASKHEKITQNNQDIDTDSDREVDKTLSIERGLKAPPQTADGVKAPPPVSAEYLGMNDYYKRSEDLEPEKTPEQLLAEQEERAERERAEKVREREKWETRCHVPAELKGKFEDEKAYFTYKKKQAIAALERRMTDNS